MMSEELHGNERRALELLPWYVNGTLEGEERELVARWSLASLVCRKELERLRRLQQLMQRDDAEAAATGRAFERLMTRIETSETTLLSRARRAVRQITWTPFALAASLAAAVSVLLMWGTTSPPAMNRSYETLTRTERGWAGRWSIAHRLRARCHRIGAAATARESRRGARRAGDG